MRSKFSRTVGVFAVIATSWASTAHADLKIGGDIGRLWEKGKKELGNAAADIGTFVEQAAPVIRDIGCPACGIIANQLGAEDKAVLDAVTGKGMILAAAGPTMGIWTLNKISEREGQAQQAAIPVNRRPAAPTSTTYSSDADCLIQFDNPPTLTAYTIDRKPFMDKARRGDRIVLRAPICSEYQGVPGVSSVTSGELILDGFSEDELAVDGELRYIVTGNPA